MLIIFSLFIPLAMNGDPIKQFIKDKSVACSLMHNIMAK